MLFGGGDPDVFDYNNVNDSYKKFSYIDTIKDFQAGLDKIDLSTIDANETVTGNQAFSYVESGASLQAGQVSSYYDQARNVTVVEANINESSFSEFKVELQGNVNLSQDDFVF